MKISKIQNVFLSKSAAKVRDLDHGEFYIRTHHVVRLPLHFQPFPENPGEQAHPYPPGSLCDKNKSPNFLIEDKIVFQI